MKRFILAAAFLAACQPATTDGETSVSEPKVADVKINIEKGIIRLRLSEPVSEPYACIVPIRVENGLEEDASVTMIAFDLTGSGNAAKGNMFAPIAGPGEVYEARVVVEGQSCDAFDTITIPKISCTSGEKTCEDKIELTGSGRLQLKRAG